MEAYTNETYFDEFYARAPEEEASAPKEGESKLLVMSTDVKGIEITFQGFLGPNPRLTPLDEGS